MNIISIYALLQTKVLKPIISSLVFVSICTIIMNTLIATREILLLNWYYRIVFCRRTLTKSAYLLETLRD